MDSRGQNASIAASKGVRSLYSAFKRSAVQPGEGQMGNVGYALGKSDGGEYQVGLSIRKAHDNYQFIAMTDYF